MGKQRTVCSQNMGERRTPCGQNVKDQQEGGEEEDHFTGLLYLPSF